MRICLIVGIDTSIKATREGIHLIHTPVLLHNTLTLIFRSLISSSYKTHRSHFHLEQLVYCFWFNHKKRFSTWDLILVSTPSQGCRSSYLPIYRAASSRLPSATSAVSLRASLCARAVTAGASAAQTSHSATVLSLTWRLWKTTCCTSQTPGGWPTRSLRNPVSQRYLLWPSKVGVGNVSANGAVKKPRGGTLAFKISLRIQASRTQLIWNHKRINLDLDLRANATKNTCLVLLPNQFLAVKYWQLPDTESRGLSVMCHIKWWLWCSQGAERHRGWKYRDLLKTSVCSTSMLWRISKQNAILPSTYIRRGRAMALMCLHAAYQSNDHSDTKSKG